MTHPGLALAATPSSAKHAAVLPARAHATTQASNRHGEPEREQLSGGLPGFDRESSPQVVEHPAHVNLGEVLAEISVPT
eukprot:6177955-Pleurochrysis_carterae.AAC.12